jgi:hypothetical protein
MTSLSRPAQALLTLRPAGLLNRPKAAFVTRLRPTRLPDQAARQLPGSTDNCKREPKAAYRGLAVSAINRSLMRRGLSVHYRLLDTKASSSGTMIIECSGGECRSAGADKAGAQDMA